MRRAPGAGDHCQRAQCPALWHARRHRRCTGVAFRRLASGARRRFACARLVGAEGGNGRKVLKDKTNTPRIMPAPAVSSAIRKIKGKARSRTHTPSVGAEAQRRRRLLCRRGHGECRGWRDARRCIRSTLSRRRRVPPLTRARRPSSTTPLPCSSMTQPSKRCLSSR